MANIQIVDTRFIRTLSLAGSPLVVTARDVSDEGWVLFVRVAPHPAEKMLVLDRSSEPRVFASLDTVASYLQRLGVRAFGVDQSTRAGVRMD